LLNQHQVGKKLQIDFSDLHPKIVKRCKIHLANGQYDDAVLVAMKLVETELRETAGLTADDVGVHLVPKVLGKDACLYYRALKQSQNKKPSTSCSGDSGLLQEPA
jgi:uncharacterized protein (TIGR02391 family)